MSSSCYIYSGFEFFESTNFPSILSSVKPPFPSLNISVVNAVQHIIPVVGNTLPMLFGRNWKTVLSTRERIRR